MSLTIHTPKKLNSLDTVCLNAYNDIPTTVHVCVIGASLDPIDNKSRLPLGDYRVTVEFRREWPHRMSSMNETHGLCRSCEPICNEAFHIHTSRFHVVRINLLDNCIVSFCRGAFIPAILGWANNTAKVCIHLVGLHRNLR